MRIVVDASGLTYRELNARVRQLAQEYEVLEVRSVSGQRYLGSGVCSPCSIEVHGIPGQDLGVFLAGPGIRVFGDAQDGVGNTMSSGRIIVDGSAGHVLGLSARGGRLFVGGDVGPRAAIHMKGDGAAGPVVVIGGHAGPFLGEYMSGGVVVVLNMPDGASSRRWPRAGTIAAGIHGGVIFIRGRVDRRAVWDGAVAGEPEADEMRLLGAVLAEYCGCFHGRFDPDRLLEGEYTVIRPRSHKPYSGQYCHEG